MAEVGIDVLSGSRGRFLMQLYRFFFHYYRGKKMMSVHFRGKCYITKFIRCTVPCETKWNKRQPYLVMQGFASHIIHGDDTIFIIGG